MKTGIIFAIVATFFFSTSPIFTRTAGALSPSQVAFFRMFGGSMFIGITCLIKGNKLSLKQLQSKYFIYGIITAFHFLFYIWSLYYVSIAQTLVIVYTAPVFVYLFEVFKGHKLTVTEILGIILTITGLGVLVGFQPELNREAVLGILMAFISAFCLAVYSLFGRREREHASLFTYTFWLYLMSAAILFPFAALNWETAFTPRETLSVIALALFPTALGHTIYNAALRRVRSFYPSIIATQEVSGGIILGALLLGELPTRFEWIGTIISLAGIVTIVYYSHHKPGKQ